MTDRYLCTTRHLFGMPRFFFGMPHQFGMLRLVFSWLGAVACATGGASAAAGAVYPGAAAPQVEIEQRLGARLPLDLAFVEADGRVVKLGDLFAPGDGGRGVPVVLVLGYYRCPRLCETVMEGALETLAQSGAARSTYRVVAVSIDPAETAADARARRHDDLVYADLAAGRSRRAEAGQGRLDLHALVGDAAAIERLAKRVGFGFVHHATSEAQRDDAAAAFDHAAGFIVVTPVGRVSRYFLGVRHDAAALRAALDDAGRDTVGSLVDRLVLLCAHLDPTLGRWSEPVLVLLRLTGLASTLMLALWVWRRRRLAEVQARP